MTLAECWPDFLNSGFFAHLIELENHSTRFSWLGNSEEAASLDMMYYFNHSGKKLASNMVLSLLDKNSVLPEAGINALVKAIAFKYERNWAKLWNTMIITYDPASNYDVVTTRELSKNDSEDESLNTTRTGAETLTHGLVAETEHGKSTTENSFVFAFDSQANSPAPSERNVSEDSGTTTVSNTGSDTTERELSDDTSRLKSTESEENEEIRKKGIIGTVSVQKLLSEDRGLWIWNFFDQVFKDIDAEMTIQFYDSCR